MSDPTLIGVWMQPADSLAEWKRRGVNTLVLAPFGHDPYQWMQTAKRLGGMNYILLHDQPWDPTDANLLAVCLPDEPDGAGNKTPAQVQAFAADVRRRGWNGPLFLSLDGSKVHTAGQAGSPSIDTYRAYLALADWVSEDLYPLNYFGDPSLVSGKGDNLDRLRVWGGAGKRLFSFIETGNQGQANKPWARGSELAKKMRGPSVPEFWSECQQAAARKAGLIYFPEQDPVVEADGTVTQPFAFDVTDPGIAVEMPKVAAVLNPVAPTLEQRVTALEARMAKVEGK